MDFHRGFSPAGYESPVGERESRDTSRPPEDLPDQTALAAMQQLIDQLPEQVALLGEDFMIVAVNRSWSEGMKAYGYGCSEPGENYRAVCEEIAATGYEPAIKVLEGLDHLVRGTRDYWQLNFNGRGKWRACQYLISFHRVVVGKRSFITVSRFDVTETVELRRLKDDVARSCVNAQEAERERLGRELHDSTSQHLLALRLLMGQLKRDLRGKRSRSLVEEIEKVVKETEREVRSTAYLSQPPALGGGLPSALKSLVEGFGNRTGLKAMFEIEGGAPDLPERIERALYRIGQEALANVQRHALAKRVRVLLRCRRSCIHLLIIDDGIGITRAALTGGARAGVGLSGMRSRLSELAGSLRVRSVSPGTAILASVPLRESSEWCASVDRL